MYEPLEFEAKRLRGGSTSDPNDSSGAPNPRLI